MALDDPLPVAVWQGTFTLFGVTLNCSVLDNGQRVIDADGVHLLFEAMAGTVTLDHDELVKFARWQRGIDP